MFRRLYHLVLLADRLHLLWGRHELDSRHPDAGYITERLANIDQRLFDLRRCRCGR